MSRVASNSTHESHTNVNDLMSITYPQQMHQHPYSQVVLVPIVAALVCLFEFICLDSGSVNFANAVGPTVLGLVTTRAATKFIQKAPVLLISCLPWTLFAIIAYACVGPLVYVFGSQQTIDSIPESLNLNADGLLRTNILNSAFIATMLATYLLFSNRRSAFFDINTWIMNLQDQRAAKMVVCICLGIGGLARIVISLDVFEGPVPGSVYHLAQLTTLALMPLWYLMSAKSYRFGWIAIPLFLFEFGDALLSFNKSTVILCILMPGTGLFLAHQSKSILATVFLLSVLVYVALTTPTAICRELVGARADVSDRIEIFTDVVQDKNGIRSRRTSDGIQWWWLRMNYANVQWFVMRRYDQGQPFDSYKNALWVFVPRILVPDKPSMTAMGLELNYLIHGQHGSSMGVGIAGEAYGVGGMLYVALAAMLLGGIFATLDSRFAFNRVGGWLYLPVQVISMKMGYRLDGQLVADYLGTMVIVFAYLQMVKVLVNMTSLDIKARNS